MDEAMVQSRMSGALAVQAGIDRRTTCRYAPRVKNLILGRVSGNSEDELPVDLESISLQGCMVTSRTRPHLNCGEPIWFRVSSLTDSDWIEGKIVAVEKRFFRKHQIRIQFASTLPFQVFKLLVYGADDFEQKPVIRPEHETDQLWR
jgi:hypothetical protein